MMSEEILIEINCCLLFMLKSHLEIHFCGDVAVVSTSIATHLYEKKAHQHCPWLGRTHK